MVLSFLKLTELQSNIKAQKVNIHKRILRPIVTYDAET